MIAPLLTPDPDPRADDCPRCDGDGEIGQGAQRQTCSVCRGSALSGEGERKLRESRP